MNKNLSAIRSALAALTLAVFASGCNQQNVKPSEDPGMLSGYTCCNLRYNKDWINDVNYGQLPMIPAGTPIKVTGYGRYRASVDIDGKPFKLEADGLLAICVQHELDHLNGKVFVEHLSALKQNRIKTKLKKRSRLEM